MKYKSVNEIDKFRYDDCVLADIKVDDTCIVLVLEALIVKRDNSQNTNYTESYAGTTNVTIKGGKITAGIKDGYKYYDANDVLIREVLDTKLDDNELKALPKLCQGAYLYDISESTDDFGNKCYVLGIEFVDEEEQAMGDSYRIFITGEDIVCEWERYMNRVQS